LSWWVVGQSGGRYGDKVSGAARHGKAGYVAGPAGSHVTASAASASSVVPGCTADDIPTCQKHLARIDEVKDVERH